MIYFWFISIFGTVYLHTKVPGFTTTTQLSTSTSSLDKRMTEVTVRPLSRGYVVFITRFITCSQSKSINI